METIYLDNAATTPVDPEVLDAMLPYYTENFGNPSSFYKSAGKSREAVDLARKRVAEAIGAAPGEIYFTSGGSESDNWAIRGAAEAYSNKGRHIITSAVEHHAVLNACAYLEKRGYSVTYLPVDGEGFVSPKDLEAAITPETILVSVIYANNEIGTIQPVNELAGIAGSRGVLFHTDAVQSAGHIPIDVAAANIGMLSLSAHKIYGPKGVGALYVREGANIEPLLFGGKQERRMRAGTENVPGIVGLGKAISLCVEEMAPEIERVSKLRDALIDGILTKIPNARLNGPRHCRLPGNANFTIDSVEDEAILLALDMKNICASSGSACTTGSLSPSHVLAAIKVSQEQIHSSLRLSLGRQTEGRHIDYLLEVLPKEIERLRGISFKS